MMRSVLESLGDFLSVQFSAKAVRSETSVMWVVCPRSPSAKRRTADSLSLQKRENPRPVEGNGRGFF